MTYAEKWWIEQIQKLKDMGASPRLIRSAKREFEREMAAIRARYFEGYGEP